MVMGALLHFATRRAARRVILALPLLLLVLAIPAESAVTKLALRSYRARVSGAITAPTVAVTLRIGPRPQTYPDIIATLWLEANTRRRKVNGRFDVKLVYPR